jgi:uncharacterized membrane protein
MGRRLLIGGLVVAILGIALVAGGFALEQSATSQNIPAQDFLTLTPSSLGSSSLSLSWSGASNGTTVYLTSGSVACPAAGALASGTGASGKLTATLSSGTSYSIFACTGSTLSAVDVSYTGVGLSPLVVIGIVLLVVGIVLVVLSRRSRKPPPAEPPTPTDAATPR